MMNIHVLVSFDKEDQVERVLVRTHNYLISVIYKAFRWYSYYDTSRDVVVELPNLPLG